MTTVSVPLPNELLEAIKQMISNGIASNKADFIRKAIRKYIEDQAVEAVLKASHEPRLSGDLRELAKKL